MTAFSPFVVKVIEYFNIYPTHRKYIPVPVYTIYATSVAIVLNIQYVIALFLIHL